MPHLNPRLIDTCSPPIPGARRWLEQYDGRMGEVLNLSQAAPGTPPPPALLSLLSKAAADPRTTGYGPIRGEPELIAAYAAHVSSIYGAAIGTGNVAITAGCNQAFLVTVLAVARAGDSVMLPTPWYFNHAMALSMLGIEAIPLATTAEDGFVPRTGVARDIIARRRKAGQSVPKAIVLVTPNNPTGAIYGSSLIEDFAELCAEMDAWIVVDETYRDFLADVDAQPPHRLFGGSHRERFIQLYSFSKAYCIPGYRLGAMIVPERMMGEIDKILDTTQICPARAGQIALAPAITSLADWRVATGKAIAKRGSYFAAVLGGVAGWRVDAIGAYFAYVAHPFPDCSDEAVAETLARERGVLVLPGSFFGAQSQTHLRFAFANVDDRRIDELPARLEGLSPTR